MLNQLTPVVKALIAINIVFYIGTVVISPQLYEVFALHFFKDPRFYFWQPLTHMFMHDGAGLMHILFNMYGLFLFGPPLERWMGSNRFIFFYLASGFGAYLLTTGIHIYEYTQWSAQMLAQGATDLQVQKEFFGTIYEPNYWGVMVGASGCLFGVLAGFAYLYPNIKLQLLFIPFPIAAKWLIGGYVLYETLSTFGILNLQSNVGHAAHLGGAIFGFIMVWFWKKNSMDKYRWD